MNTSIRKTGIIGIGSSVPEKVLTNAYFETIVETSDEWIVSRSGIRERRQATENEAASDFAVKAGAAALESCGVKPEELDLVICATFTGDHPLPATASIVQHKLGATNAAAFDLAAGCSGFVYGLSVAHGFIASGTYDKILVVGVDLLSKITDYTDRTTCVLFGDGAGAAVVAPTEDDGIMSIVLGSDGSGADALKIEGGGSRTPTCEASIEQKLQYITMAGAEVFKFAVRIMGDATTQALEKCGLTPEDVDLFVPHQANVRIIDSATRRLGIPAEKVFMNVERYGNTSAASIPLALDEACKAGKLKKGDIVVVVGFGAGLTWAANVIRWEI